MTQSPERRTTAQRLDAAIKVSFSINDGPALVAETMNFTYRTVAIRSDVKAHIDDAVALHIARLPSLNGKVVRAFEDGFAIRLDEMSLSLVAHAQAEDLVEAQTSTSPDRHIGAIVRARGPLPAWARLSSSKTPNNGAHRHFVTLISNGEFEITNLRNVWISMNETRWIARVRRARQRGKQSIVVVIINDWQLRVAAQYGLSISLVCKSFEQSSFDIPASVFDDHISALNPRAESLTA